MGTANRHSETGRQGPTKGATEDVPGLIAEGYNFKDNGERCALQEIGPRFTLKCRYLQHGTFDARSGEYEYIWRPDAQVSRKKFFAAWSDQRIQVLSAYDSVGGCKGARARAGEVDDVFNATHEVLGFVLQSSNFSQEVLHAAQTASRAAMQNVDQARLEQWRRDPKAATSFLAGAKASVVMELLPQMVHSQIQVNAFHCSAALSACEKKSVWTSCLHILDFMKTWRVAPNEIHYSVAMKALRPESHWRQGLHLLSSVVTAPNAVHASLALGSCPSWPQALRVMQVMRELRLQSLRYSCWMSSWRPKPCGPTSRST
ncbi:Brix domain-containing protein F44G4.1 [Durusdinium trenchii]|uniref:Brix domain-containing protein F44G4.1 n=1 Tax=Durusdinium trenchii TaxID=1381693 RepID=A0ABP0R1G1_9DINO